MPVSSIPKAIVCIAVLGVFSLKGMTQDTGGYKFFHTPSKNIWCGYSNEYKTLRCDVEKRAWKDWGCKDSGCFGTAFILPNSGKATPKRVSDTVIGSGETILAYGQSITLDAITCHSDTSGLTCLNKSGGRFHLNREFYQINQ
jgi:hypothetical protein